jgi:hypothetical protein
MRASARPAVSVAGDSSPAAFAVSRSDETFPRKDDGSAPVGRRDGVSAPVEPVGTRLATLVGVDEGVGEARGIGRG